MLSQDMGMGRECNRCFLFVFLNSLKLAVGRGFAAAMPASFFQTWAWRPGYTLTRGARGAGRARRRRRAPGSPNARCTVTPSLF
jgi:hypothetical protein